MKRKLLFVSSILIIIFCLTGCWNSRELNTIGISLVMGFDLEDNGEVLVTAEIIKPNPAKRGLGEQEIEYVQGRGKSILEAIRNMTLKFDRKLFASHSKVFIFGEDFAKRNNMMYMDLFQRDDELRETTYILIAKGSKAYEIMGISAGIEEVPANYILQLIENKKFNGKTVDVDILQFIKYYYEEGLQSVVGVIEKREKAPINKEDVGKEKKEYELSVEGAAVFKYEKLVGYLDGIETRGFNFLNGDIEGGVIQFPIPSKEVDKSSTSTPKAEGSAISSRNISNEVIIIEVIRSKTQKDIEIKNGKILFKVDVKIKGMVDEVVGDIDISDEEILRKVEEACSLEVKNNMEKVIKKAQNELKVDIFEFASLFHRKYPKEWHKIKKDWNNIFPETEINVAVETNIIRTGLINTPTNKIKGE